MPVFIWTHVSGISHMDASHLLHYSSIEKLACWLVPKCGTNPQANGFLPRMPGYERFENCIEHDCLI